MTASHRHPTQYDSHRSLAARTYPHGTRARYIAKKCRCPKCRAANTAYYHASRANPRTSAEPARAHIARLQAQGIGLRAISDATDIPRVALKRIMLGQPTAKQANVEKILTVDEQAAADYALVDAKETQRLLRELVDEGFRKTRIAALLGSEARFPALQFKAGKVLAKSAHRVKKLHAQLMDEASSGVDDEEDDSGIRERVSPRECILRALRWFDAVESEDLLDAIGVPSTSTDRAKRNTWTQALLRLAKSGEVVKHGSGCSATYALARRAA